MVKFWNLEMSRLTTRSLKKNSAKFWKPIKGSFCQVKSDWKM